MLTNEQKHLFQAELVKRQETLIEQAEDRYGLLASQTDAVGELSSYDNHPADMGTELFERGKDVALYARAEAELEEINEALHAIHEGTYGICRECSAPIDIERLQAMPTADKCMAHASDRLDMEKRPSEEAVLRPQINPPTEADAEQTGYDAEDAWQEVSKYGTSETPSDFYGDRDNYNDMYPNSDENRGYVEDVESYASNHLDE